MIATLFITLALVAYSALVVDKSARSIKFMLLETKTSGPFHKKVQMKYS